jgi:hypothetical protein
MCSILISDIEARAMETIFCAMAWWFSLFFSRPSPVNPAVLFPKDHQSLARGNHVAGITDYYRTAAN